MDKPLHRIDHMMWDVETPTSLVTITGMMFLKETISKQEVESVIENRLLRYERFHKKIVSGADNKPVWRVDDNFNFRSHVHHIALPAPGTYRELQEVISDLMSQPLDYSKPLWQAHLIDNYEGGQVLLWRLHHAIADGIALIKVVLSLTSSSPEESLRTEHPAKPHAHPEVSSHTFRDEVIQVLHEGQEWYHEAQQLLEHPGLLIDRLEDSWKATKELVRLFISPSLEGTIYKGALSVAKKAAWTKPLPISVVKQIGHMHHATINDVLLSLISGAIRRHLIAHQQAVDKGLRVVCPVNVRKKEEIVKVHNKIGMLSFELPVHLSNPKDRINYIREKTHLLKHSWEPVIVYNLLTALADLIPKNLEKKFAELMGERIAGVLTNVPGPREAIYFAGKKVEDMMFWVPQTGPLGIGISMISYNGNVYLGIVTDNQLIDDPDKIIEGFYEEFDILESMLQLENRKTK